MSEAIIVRGGNVTKTYVDTQDALKVDKIEGKGLSTNDYTNDAKAAVEALGTASTYDAGTSEGEIPILIANGKLDTSVIPAIAITDVFTAESEEAMLALDADKGDVCIRTDLSKTFILKIDPASTLENWAELATPTDLVQSVNSKTGVVILNANDVGAVPVTRKINEHELSSDLSLSAIDVGAATKTRYTATIGSSWQQSESNEYIQEVTVSGLLETDTPTIDIILSDTVSTAKAQIDAWSCISRITTDEGKIVVYCYDSAPTMALNIQLLCVR